MRSRVGRWSMVVLFVAVMAACGCLADRRASAALATSSFTIKGAVKTARTYTLAELRREPVTTETVYFNTGKGPVTGSFTGVLLWTLLQETGIKVNPGIKNDILRRTVVVTGTDGYAAAFAAGELDPEFGGALVIVAYAQDGATLSGNAGFARIIVPGDKAGGRAVMSIASIEVR